MDVIDLVTTDAAWFLEMLLEFDDGLRRKLYILQTNLLETPLCWTEETNLTQAKNLLLIH